MTDQSTTTNAQLRTAKKDGMSAARAGKDRSTTGPSAGSLQDAWRQGFDKASANMAAKRATWRNAPA